MVRSRVLLLVLPVACLLAATAFADIEKDGGGRSMLAEPDPNSTFMIGSLTNQLPLTTIAVPIYLDTESTLDYLQCYIVWPDSAFEFDSITWSAFLPDTATTQFAAMGDDTIKLWLSNEEEFVLSSSEPFAFVNLDVLCFGYGTTTEIEFYDDDEYNYYTSSGSYSPVRYGGEVGLKSVYATWYDIENATALPGEESVDVVVVYHQNVPGKPIQVKLTFDSSSLVFDEVTPLPGLVGESIYSTVTGDTLELLFWPTDPLVAVDEEIEICTISFDLVNGADDVSYTLAPFYGLWRTACGNYEEVDYLVPGWIMVPDHVATADIDEVGYYSSATGYSVPIEIDSNMPVDSLYLEVEFPSDSLTYVDLTIGAGYPAPDVITNQDYPDLLKFRSVASFGMDLEDLPDDVFAINFSRNAAYPVGTKFKIRFWTVNKVWFDRYGGLGMHEADLTLDDGMITIVPTPPPPSCPALYVWNGETFARENTILPQCDGRTVETDVTDWYLMNNAVAAVDGQLRFQVREDGLETSRFSDFRLLAIDHPADQAIQVTREGEIITLGRLFMIKSARDHNGEDIKPLLAARDGVYYDSREDGWFEIDFGTLSPEQIRRFVSTSQEPRPKEPDVLKAGEDAPDSKLRISVKTEDGWILVSEADSRAEKTLQTTLVEKRLLSPDRDLVLRYSWEGWYRTDMIEFREAEEWKGVPVEPVLLRAEHTAPSGHCDAVAASPAGVLTLSRGEVIDLVFDANELAPISRDVRREWIFVSTGRYSRPDAEETPRGVFALDANVPNPFNPTTTIAFNLPTTSRVEIKVYDVRGALVRTLVAGVRNAGEQTVLWDGTNDAGSRMASGVYFCRMTAPGYERTRKLILLR
ncbi:MAG: T9SS type A sorting domain-containing protein [Candidatus Krumholzibacteriota bacterium]|nr:T9SS type A sorting domain-containing protein [Candidatus Krumholzibacteriota bacterium]